MNLHRRNGRRGLRPVAVTKKPADFVRALLVTALVTAPPAVAQDDEPERTAPPDPYTQGREEALEALGYERIGRLAWAGDHDTARI